MITILQDIETKNFLSRYKVSTGNTLTSDLQEAAVFDCDDVNELVKVWNKKTNKKFQCVAVKIRTNKFSWDYKIVL